MRRPPPLSDALHYPVTGMMCAAAVGITLASMHSGGLAIASVVMNDKAMTTEPWRLVGSAFPHGSLMHLVFNLYWVWALGTAVEAVFGSVRHLLFVVLAAAVSAGAEYALFRGGIGLSGVVYAYFGLLWALKRRPRYVGMIDRATITMFTTWFFVCIVLTELGVMNVANVAHGMGAVIGALVGKCIGARTSVQRAAWIVATAAVCGVVWLGGTVWRPYVNLESAHRTLVSKIVTPSLEQQFADAWADKRYEDAVPLLRQLVAKNPSEARLWMVLGWTLNHLHRYEEAAEVLSKGLDLKPTDVETLELLGHVQYASGQLWQAGETWQRALDLDPENTGISQNLMAIHTAPSPWMKGISLP